MLLLLSSLYFPVYFLSLLYSSFSSYSPYINIFRASRALIRVLFTDKQRQGWIMMTEERLGRLNVHLAAYLFWF